MGETGGSLSRLFAIRSPVPVISTVPGASMIQRQSIFTLLTAILMLANFGCSGYPLISPNREGFAPWDKLPEGDGITYVNKYTHDPGIDPLYLALFRYADDAALQRAVQTFGLVPLANGEDSPTFTTTMPEMLSWFPLANVTERYVVPDDDVAYVANIWVDSMQNLAVIERTWW